VEIYKPMEHIHNNGDNNITTSLRTLLNNMQSTDAAGGKQSEKKLAMSNALK
jgi:hypothetical protein